MSSTNGVSIKDAPKVDPSLKSELTSFDATSKLHHTETSEKNTLPSMEDVQKEKTEQAVLKGVEGFDKEKLKHTETEEKVVLPGKEDIQLEKGQQQLREGIEGFDANKLKHAQTVEKNALPTKEDLEAERKA